MASDSIEYEIHGHGLQMVEIILDPGETVIAEAGAMNYLEEGISFEARMGDGSAADKGVFSKMWGAGKRLLSGESLFMTHFTNTAQQVRRVAFASPYPGAVVPICLADHGGTLVCQKDAFLAAAKGTEIGIAFTKKLGSGFFGGEGFILQKLQGDGQVFLHAGGTVIEKRLQNATLRVDTGCLVGFSDGIDYDIKLVKGLKSLLFGGEGLWMATLSGTGTVWVQSLPFSRLADRILAHAPSAGGKEKGED